MTKQEHLQKLVRDFSPPGSEELWVEYRPFRGWYLVAAEARYFGDEGDFLGRNYLAAKETLNWMF